MRAEPRTARPARQDRDEHVWNTTKNNTANIQHETPEESSTRSPPTSPAAPSTTTSSTSHSAKPETILFHDGHMLRIVATSRPSSCMRATSSTPRMGESPRWCRSRPPDTPKPSTT
ncbi:hypothetical protein HMPREF0682_2786 [Propionibacterium acidifaciens F0233]|uniref:Uncharacterized protein n=1 Tax=Propionibacterium acidifaciens F0233 TaxID=553198 RepID=U2PM13_9ACTN|nr:hypothetical protein HMPREF0682_2786 [Propionibacterium acidifaciens F0233]